MSHNILYYILWTFLECRINKISKKTFRNRKPGIKLSIYSSKNIEIVYIGT